MEEKYSIVPLTGLRAAKSHKSNIIYKTLIFAK